MDSDTDRSPAVPPVMSQFLALAEEMRAAHLRMQELLTAVISLAEDLSLEGVLDRVVRSACRLVGARYGALGVLGEDGMLKHFLTVGISEEEARRIGPLPTGHGVLGLLIRDPRPLRLSDLRTHPEAHGFPPHHPPMTSFLGVPIRVRNVVFGNLYLTDKAGGNFTREDEELAVALAAAAGVAIENARLYDDARTRERWREAAMRATGAVLVEEMPEEALAAILRESRRVSAAARALVAVPAGAGDIRLYVEAAEGQDAEALVGRTLEAGPALSRGLASGQPFLLDHGAGLGVDRLGPALVAPLGTPASDRDALVLMRDRAAEAFTPVEVSMAGVFAAQLGLARELARTRKAREELVVSADRERIALDLHDLVIQRLFAAGLSVQSLRRFTADQDALTRIGSIAAELDTTIRELRHTIYSLRDGPGERAPFSSRVLHTVLHLSKAMPFTPRLRFAGDVDTAVPVPVQEQLLAVLTEALSNAARHSRAGSIDLLLAVDEDGVMLSVADDGDGFDPELVPHSGIANLEHRARLLGGELSLRTSPGSGTRVTLVVPRGGAAALGNG